MFGKVRIKLQINKFFMRILLHMFLDNIFPLGSFDIEDVEKLLDEIGSLKESESKTQSNYSVPEATNSINGNNASNEDDVVFDNSRKLEPKIENETVIEVFSLMSLKIISDS